MATIRKLPTWISSGTRGILGTFCDTWNTFWNAPVARLGVFSMLVLSTVVLLGGLAESLDSSDGDRMPTIQTVGLSHPLETHVRIYGWSTEEWRGTTDLDATILVQNRGGEPLQIKAVHAYLGDGEVDWWELVPLAINAENTAYTLQPGESREINVLQKVSGTGDALVIQVVFLGADGQVLDQFIEIPQGRNHGI